MTPAHRQFRSICFAHGSSLAADSAPDEHVLVAVDGPSGLVTAEISADAAMRLLDILPSAVAVDGHVTLDLPGADVDPPSAELVVPEHRLGELTAKIAAQFSIQRTALGPSAVPPRLPAVPRKLLGAKR